MDDDDQAPTTKGAFSFFQQADETGGAAGGPSRGRPPTSPGATGTPKSSTGGGLFFMPDIQLNPTKGVIGDFVCMVNNSVRLEVRDLYRILQSCEARKLQLGPTDMELLFAWFEEFEILCVDLFEMEEDLLFAFIERNDHLSRYDRVWSGEGDKLKGALCEAKRTLAKGTITSAFARFNDLEDEFCGRPTAQVFPALAPAAEQLASAILSFVALKDQELPPALQTRFSEKEIRAQEKKYWAETKVMEHSDVILSLATRSLTPDERVRWKARALPSRAAILGLRTSGAELYARFERCHLAFVTESEELVETAKAERAKLIEASKLANGAVADRENFSSVIELQLAKIKEDSEAAAAKAARRKLGPLRALKSPRSAVDGAGSTPASPMDDAAVEELMSPVSEVDSPTAPSARRSCVCCRAAARARAMSPQRMCLASQRAPTSLGGAAPSRQYSCRRHHPTGTLSTCPHCRCRRASQRGSRRQRRAGDRDSLAASPRRSWPQQQTSCRGRRSIVGFLSLFSVTGSPVSGWY
eukprot:TRINITY_DN1959_c0_g1_i3.p1 TRINITY_DN1959_c0_g1~~TRINITY_DN1959_c0_g1_i3.p1  ORF type:complete len:528 (+),score=135.52 TRINITY_DN1959_c0_g1_i3:734-2317(+)